MQKELNQFQTEDWFRSFLLFKISLAHKRMFVYNKKEKTGAKEVSDMGMNGKSKIILWILNLLACADPGILYSLAKQDNFLPLLVYRVGMPLIWGMLWVPFVQTFRKSRWDAESKKQAWTMMLAMLVLNVCSVSAALSRQGNLAVYSLILIGLYLGKIVEHKMR